MLMKYGFLSSLRYRSFLLLWVNLFILRLGLNALDILMTWLVLQASDSALLLSLVTGLRTLPFAFGLVAGAFSDRFDKRKLLILSNIIFIVATFLMGLVILEGATQFWHILLATFILHTLNAFETPVRQVLVTDIVGRENTINGVALNGLAQRVSSVVGAALIGAFVYVAGVGPLFFILGALAVAALLTLIPVRIAKTQTILPAAGKSMLTDMADGLRYVAKKKSLLGLQLIALSHNFFTGVCLFTLMPVFASTILHIDASGLGWINTMSGLGSLAAGLGLAALGTSYRRKGLLVPIGAVVEGGTWVLFSLTTSYLFSVSYVAASAVGMLTYMTAIETLLLTNSEPEMRGRVMGVRALVILPQAAWGLILGALSQVIGVPATMMLAGISHCILVLTITALEPTITRLD